MGFYSENTTYAETGCTEEEKKKAYIPLDSGANIGSHFTEQESTEHKDWDRLYIA